MEESAEIQRFPGIGIIMARLTKTGLDYFPLDVDIDQDDKIALIEAQHGVLGFGVIIKLLMKIYANGYYYEWGEKEQLLFSRRVNVDINSLNAIINDSIKWGLFDISKHEKYGILTSRGIQKRYFEATTRRQSVDLIDAYACLSKKDLETYKNIINVNINSQNVDINTLSDDVDVSINPQSKVEKSKVKNSIEESSAKTDPDNSVITEKDCVITKNNTAEADALFESIWKLYPNKSGKNSIKAATKKKLFKVGLETLNTCLERYKKDLAINTWKQPMNGSTFFNGRYADYLDENYEEMKNNGGNEKHGGGITDEYKREWSSLGLEIG